MRRYLTSIGVFGFTLMRRFLRDKVAIFFTFLFPLIFLLVFGTINSNSGDASFDIALINNSDTQFSREFIEQLGSSDAITIKQGIDSYDDARDRLGRGEIDSILELPASFGEINQDGLPSGNAIVYYQESSPQAGQTFAAVMAGITDGINAQLVPQAKLLGVEARATTTSGLSSFDYVFSGLIGFSILSLGLFGLANGIPADKKAGYMRRLRATPLRPSQLLLATATTYMLLGLISVALMMAVGLWLFNFDMRGDYFTFAIFVALGLAVILGFGLAIGGWAKNENQAAPLTNLIAIPMMFLSGSFFPRFVMPDWLQVITDYLPLTPIIDGMRLIMTESRTLIELGPQIGLMALWLVVIYFLAFRLFRWE